MYVCVCVIYIYIYVYWKEDFSGAVNVYTWRNLIAFFKLYLYFIILPISVFQSIPGFVFFFLGGTNRKLEYLVINWMEFDATPSPTLNKSWNPNIWNVKRHPAKCVTLRKSHLGRFYCGCVWTFVNNVTHDLDRACDLGLPFFHKGFTKITAKR